MEEIRKLNPIIPILTILLAVAIGLCIYLWLGKSKAEKLVEEYKTSYDNLVEENKKAINQGRRQESHSLKRLKENHESFGFRRRL